jgi:hypothetical protein
MSIDAVAALLFLTIGGAALFLGVGLVGEAGIGLLGLDAIVGTEGVLDLEAITSAVREFPHFDF